VSGNEWYPKRNLTWAKFDYEYIYSILKNTTRIVDTFDESKEFGTPGERYAANNTRDYMIDLGLSCVHQEEIDSEWSYSDSWHTPASNRDPYIGWLFWRKTPTDYSLEINVYSSKKEENESRSPIRSESIECFPLLKKGLFHNQSWSDLPVYDEIPLLGQFMLLVSANWTEPYEWAISTTFITALLLTRCKGFIVTDIDFDNTIFMLPSFGYNIFEQFNEPGFSINGSDGNWILGYIDDEDYDVEATFVNNWQWEDVTSYNVIGQINGSDSDNVSIVCAHYDCWWNQGAVDEDNSVATMLAIAKYFKENNIIPRHTLKFIAFGGEEWGFRGSKDYVDEYCINGDEEIKYVFNPGNYGHDSYDLGWMDDLPFELISDNSSIRTIISDIADVFNYTGKTGLPWEVSDEVGGEDSKVFYETVDEISVLQFSRWPYEGYHRDGNDHTEGDVLVHIDNETNKVECELIAAIVSYFMIDYQVFVDNYWNLISLPANESINKTDLIIRYNGSEYSWDAAVSNDYIVDYIFGWDQINQSYIFADILKPGYGYWIFGKVSCNLHFNSSSLNDDKISDLNQYWTIFSLPFDSYVNKEDIIVEYNNIYYNWSVAVTNNIITNCLFGWKENDQQYFFADVIRPGYGYWMYAYKECTLLYNGTSVIFGGDSDGGGKDGGDGQLWAAQLTITSNYSDASTCRLFFGENENANDGSPADDYDAPTPPCSPEPYISAWFNDNLSGIYSSLSKDIRYGADIEKTWNLTTYWKPVGSNNTTVNITWDYTTDKESEYNTMILYDIENDTTIDMLTQSYYNYSIASDTSRSFQILCSNGTLPVIKNVTNSPDTVGFGYNVTVSADVYHNANDIDYVKVNITYPDSSTDNFTMDNIYNDSYEFVFNDTWQGGIFNYYIWAVDILGNSSYTRDYCFNVSASANISISTIKNSYTEAVRNEAINITDPPGPITPCIGYELLDDNSVLHIWNKFDSYYFNTSSGIQLTNHYDEYWSHNVLMLGYYNNDEWNLIYRTDELSGFNKNIDTDNSTYVNATLWKDLNYGGYDFRLAVRYHLGLDDNDLTIIPYIKNLGDAIPYNLGFAWEINDIQIDMTQENDYIEINNTIYYLNETLDMSFTNMTIPVYCWNETLNETVVCGYEPLPFFEIRENISDNCTKTLYLKWNSNLDYKVQVKSRGGEYNAPVILGIKIGTLNVNQSKHTRLHWYDASQVSYYFDGYDREEAWATNPDKMVDIITSTYASTTSDGDVELCNSNECNGTDLGIISKVEMRMKGYYSGGSAADIYLRPVFDGRTDGSDYTFDLGTTANWSQWFDITHDESAPEGWNWNNITYLDLDVEADTPPFGFPTPTAYGKNPVIRVTYTLREPPSIYNPIPANGTTNVSISPVLNITVSDVNNDSLDITWYWTDNISGSVTWQQFGTNNSVGNGTYRQTLSNASVNGQWWYWKINVSDDTYYNESDIFQFYTGHQSKIVNTGSTNISGYLLMQIHFYNTSTTSWVVDLDVINETSPRIINISQQLGLDTIFNGLVNTNDLSYGDGTYRVYAAFRDPDGDVLVCDDETALEAWWKFEVEY